MTEIANNGTERRREAVANEARFTKLETQVARLISDAESEKGTRERIAVGVAESFAKVEARIDRNLETIEGLSKNQEMDFESRSEAHEKRIVTIENKIIWFSAVTSTVVSVLLFIIHLFFRT